MSVKKIEPILFVFNFYNSERQTPEEPCCNCHASVKIIEKFMNV